MNDPTQARQSAAGGTTATRSTTEPTGAAEPGQDQAASAAAGEPAAAAPEGAEHGGHDITVTIPLDRIAHNAAHVALLPVSVARQVLPAKGGLPLYLGLGALGAFGVLEWPVAVGIGAGYAILRRAGRLNPPASSGAKGDGQAD